MDLNKTFYVIGPDEEGDNEIYEYNRKKNNLYESPGPAQKALDRMIWGYNRLQGYEDFTNRLRKKKVLEVKVTLSK